MLGCGSTRVKAGSRRRANRRGRNSLIKSDALLSEVRDVRCVDSIIIFAEAPATLVV